eukprot:6206159-Pleurochrysis_carterae.AAC.2
MARMESVFGEMAGVDAQTVLTQSHRCKRCAGSAGAAIQSRAAVVNWHGTRPSLWSRRAKQVPSTSTLTRFCLAQRDEGTH